MIDTYRTPTPPEPDDEELEEEEQEEKPEPPTFPTIWIAIMLFAIEAALYFFFPIQGTLVLAAAFDVMLYSGYRIQIARAHADEYASKMKQLQQEAAARRSKEELKETEWANRSYEAICSISRSTKKSVDDILIEHTKLSKEDARAMARWVITKGNA